MSCHFQHHLHSSRPLCIQADSSFVSFHTFWLDVAEQAAQIQQLEQPVWALWQEDSYEFLVLLFAALQAGKQVLLPPHRVSDLEKELAEQQIYFLKRLPSTVTTTFELQFDAAFFNQIGNINLLQRVIFRLARMHRPPDFAEAAFADFKFHRHCLRFWQANLERRVFSQICCVTLHISINPVKNSIAYRIKLDSIFA